MHGQLFNLWDINVIASDFIPESQREFYRKPRSKSRRIVKKWKNVSTNWRDTMPMYFIGGNAVAHSKTIEKLLLAI